MKRLILLRHGATTWPENGLDDRDRSLTSVGLEEGLQQARWLTAKNLVPDYALISTARRARQTWDIMRENLQTALPHQFDDALYLAEPGTLLAHIETVPDDAQTALIIAHNPGIEALARLLAGAAPDAAAMRDLTRGFPTAGLAIFTVAAESWEQITVASTRLVDFARPHTGA